VPAPATKGLHHVKLPVSDLDASLAWYARVLGAQHQAQFDHFDERGQRWAPHAATAMDGYDPISFAAGRGDDVQSWAAHLDEEGIAHSPVSQGAAGALLVFADPDGTFLRLLELPAGGVEDIKMPAGPAEPEGPWIAPPKMSHPG